jgi:hypothetical protein
MQNYSSIIGAPPVETFAQSELPGAASLRVHLVAIQVHAAYSHALRTEIFPYPATTGVDRKVDLAYRRTLDDYEAYLCLGVIWQASRYVTECELAAAGLSRVVEDGVCLTAHGLAVQLCHNPSDVAKTVRRVRNISIAACEFRLIERAQHFKTKIELKGTEVLHDLMTKVARRAHGAFQAIQPASATRQTPEFSGLIAGRTDE